ncbi:MAG: putative substrate-binding transport lipoprotein [Amnibacterium sp.]|nr:putative substrate-binding transport lipoprotein [Amnibacterium sp.]
MTNGSGFRHRAIGRRQFLGGVGALGLTAALAACSSPAGGAKAGDGPVTLTWWSWLSNAPALAKAYEKQYPNVKIQFTQVPGGTPAYTKYGAALRAGSGAADVLQIEYQELPQFASEGHIVDMTSYVKKYMAGFPDFTKRMVTYQGKIWGAPIDLDPMMLLYRPDTLQKHSIPVPTTWTDFASAAKTLHEADPSKYMTFFAPNNGGRMMGMLWQGGATPFEDQGNGTWKIDFTSTAAKQVMNFWGDLIKAGYVKVDTDFTPAWGNSIANGVYATDVGAIWSPTYEIGPYLKKAGYKWKAAVMPQWDASNPLQSMWGGLSFAVTDQCKNPAAAAQFATWLGTNKTALESHGTAGGLYCASKDFANTAAFTSGMPVLGGQKENQLVSTIIPTLEKSMFQWSPWTQYAYGQLQAQMQDAVTGKITYNQALANVQASVVQTAKQQGYKVA